MRFRGLLMSSTFVLALIALALGGNRASAQTVFTCDGKIPTIVGSGVINGTGGDDVIIGSAGDDIINGGSGNDTICGEGGNDVINAGSGNDRMWGEVRGGGFDTLNGTPGNDIIDGGSGNDLLVDPQGFGQTLSAGSGDDTVLGNGILFGGSGNDAVTVLIAGGADANLSISAGSGTDTCTLNGNVIPTSSCEILP
jgi:Ca2+-binding RTX toxin-like protein